MAVVAAKLTLTRHMNLNEYADKIEKAALTVSLYVTDGISFSDTILYRPLARASTSLVTSVERHRLRSIPRPLLPS